MSETFDSTWKLQKEFSIKVVALWNVNEIVNPNILSIKRQRFLKWSIRSSKINKI